MDAKHLLGEYLIDDKYLHNGQLSEFSKVDLGSKARFRTNLYVPVKKELINAILELKVYETKYQDLKIAFRDIINSDFFKWRRKKVFPYEAIIDLLLVFDSDKYISVDTLKRWHKELQ